jgi:hypothetical protein
VGDWGRVFRRGRGGGDEEQQEDDGKKFGIFAMMFRQGSNSFYAEDLDTAFVQISSNSSLVISTGLNCGSAAISDNGGTGAKPRNVEPFASVLLAYSILPSLKM